MSRLDRLLNESAPNAEREPSSSHKIEPKLSRLERVMQLTANTPKAPRVMFKTPDANGKCTSHMPCGACHECKYVPDAKPYDPVSEAKQYAPELETLTDEEILNELGIIADGVEAQVVKNAQSLYESAGKILNNPKEKHNVTTNEDNTEQRKREAIRATLAKEANSRKSRLDALMRKPELQSDTRASDSPKTSVVNENPKATQQSQSSAKSSKKAPSRLDKLKLKRGTEEDSFSRGISQRLRKDRVSEYTSEANTNHYAEKTVTASRLDKLMGTDTGHKKAKFKRIERQQSLDDSHLVDSTDKHKHAIALDAAIREREAKLNTESPFKVVSYEQLDDSQKRAVDADHHYMIIDGSAGTGKSTTLAAKIERIVEDIPSYPVCDLRRNNDHVTSPMKAVAFISFTGKAVQNMRERLPKEFRQWNCMTSHRFLGYYPDEIEVRDKETGEVNIKRMFIPAFDNVNQLNYHTIVIDEAGMLPPKLLNEIIIACPNARILMVGDSAQLPAVQGVAPFNVYRTTLPVYTLETVHRTSEDDLVVNATRIREGKEPIWNNENAFMLQISNRAQFAEGQVYSAISNLYKDGKFDPDFDTIIVTNNDYEMGQINLNAKLRRVFNADVEPVRINALTHIARYGIGDKVICTSNNDEQGLTNGMIGWVVDVQRNSKYVRPPRDSVIDASNFDLVYEAAKDADDKEPGQRECSHIVYVHFPTCYGANKVVPIHTQGGYSALGLGYVTTCHKAQGSEYRNVITVMHASGKRLVNREWFYTAWTRAKEKAYVLCDINTLSRAGYKQALPGDTAAEKASNYYARFKDEIAINTQRFWDDTGGTGNINIYSNPKRQFDINRPILIGENYE